MVLEDVALDHVPRQLRRYSVVDGRRRTGTEIGELCVRALQLLIQDDADISFITADPVPR